MKSKLKITLFRIQNTSRSCVLLRSINNNLWSMPMAVMNRDSNDSFLYGIKYIKALNKDAKILSVQSIFKSEFSHCEEELEVTVYDIRYKGKLVPREGIERWITTSSFMKSKDIAAASQLFADAMLKEMVLR